MSNRSMQYERAAITEQSDIPPFSVSGKKGAMSIS